MPVGRAVPHAPTKALVIPLAEAVGEEQLWDSKDLARHSIFVHIFN